MLVKKKIDLGIIVPLLCFAVISLITIHSASTYISATLGNLALKQLLWYLVGMVLVFILLRIKNDYLYRNVWILYGICNLHQKSIIVNVGLLSLVLVVSNLVSL